MPEPSASKQPSAKRSGCLARFTTAVAVTLVWGAVGGAVYVAHLLSTANIRRLIVEGLEEATGASVRIAEVSYSLSGHATLRGLVIEGLQQGNWLVRRVEVDEARVTFHRPGAVSLHIIVDAAHATRATADLAEIEPLGPAASQPSPDGPGVSLAPSVVVTVNHLTLRVRTRDMLAAPEPWRVRGLKARVEITPDQPARVTLDGTDPDWGRIEARGSVDVARGAGRLQVKADGVHLSPDVLRTLPQVGPELAEQFTPRGRVSCQLTADFDAGDAKALRPVGHVDFHDLEVCPAQQPHARLIARGRVELTPELARIDLKGAVADGTWQLDGSLRADASGRSVDLSLRFENCQLAKLLDPKLVEQAKVKGLASGEAIIKGRLDDPKTWVGRGKVTLTKADLWKVPIVDAVVSSAKTITIGRGDVGRGEFNWSLDRGLVLNEGCQLIGPTVAIMSPSGWISLNGRLELDVVLAPRVLPTGVPIIGHILKWTHKLLVKHVIKIEVGGSIEEPDARVVPLHILSEATSVFFKTVMGGIKPK